MPFKEVTKQLSKYLDQLRQIFLENEPPEHFSDRAFFTKMKTETTPIYQLLDEWEQLAMASVKNREVPIHPQQIQATKENFELIILHSYYIDIRKRRYMELYQSIQYIFEQILQDSQAGET